jgi:broad specificity phosphatase PhoE
MELVLVRHGESEGNVAAAAAEASGAEVIEVPARDADVRLSDLGRRQSAALGMPLGDRVAAGARVWVSPYVRAVETFGEAASAAGLKVDVAVSDERLRDRELGILDTLTAAGVEARFPAEAARRRWLGKYYYRPPGGESWADVRLRLREALRDIAPTEGPAVLVTHEAVIVLLVAQLLGWGEAELLSFARAHIVANASITRLESNGRAWRLVEFAAVEHLEAAGVTATVHPGDRDARIH